MTVKGKELKELLQKNDSIIVPGAYDALTAKLIEKVGFPTVFMSGFGVSGSLLGKPDIGLITMKEMIQQAENINSCIDIPLIVDGDNGYGNELNVARMIEAYERIGAAAIQIEDQGIPKRCGHMENKSIIPLGESLKKIRMALNTRNDPNTLIIARTDARAVDGIDEALRRCTAYANEGADIIFLEAPQTVGELELISRELKGVTLMANMVETGHTPLLSKEDLSYLGYKIILWPITALLTGVKAIEESLIQLRENGISTPSDKQYSFDEYTRFIGLHDQLNMSKMLM